MQSLRHWACCGPEPEGDCKLLQLWQAKSNVPLFRHTIAVYLVPQGLCFTFHAFPSNARKWLQSIKRCKPCWECIPSLVYQDFSDSAEPKCDDTKPWAKRILLLLLLLLLQDFLQSLLQCWIYVCTVLHKRPLTAASKISSLVSRLLQLQQ